MSWKAVQLLLLCLLFVSGCSHRLICDISGGEQLITNQELKLIDWGKAKELVPQYAEDRLIQRHPGEFQVVSAIPQYTQLQFNNVLWLETDSRDFVPVVDIRSGNHAQDNIVARSLMEGTCFLPDYVSRKKATGSKD